MSKLPSVGVVGVGFVGKAIIHAFEHYTDVKAYDVDPKRTVHTYDETIQQDILFLCLPTPMKSDGTADCSLISDVIVELTKHECKLEREIFIKSTIPPFFLSGLASNRLRIFHSPEFLTERTADLDFITSGRVVFGTLFSKDVPNRAITLFTSRFPGISVNLVSCKESAMIKYITNSFFSTKISFFNEAKQICDAIGADFETVVSEVLTDGRIGHSHFNVPGHDGKLGFGGHCFPKDLNEYIKIAEACGVSPTVSNAVWSKNVEVRPECDWEADIGRAVTKDFKRQSDSRNTEIK